MTLDELLEIKSALEYGKFVDSYLDECKEAIEIIDREIRLKKIEHEYDIKGNKVEE